LSAIEVWRTECLPRREGRADPPSGDLPAGETDQAISVLLSASCV